MCVSGRVCEWQLNGYHGGRSKGCVSSVDQEGMSVH